MLDGRDWYRLGGASPEALARLRACAPAALPERYLALLAYSNGGEGPLAAQPYRFALDSAETVAEAVETRMHEEYFPGFLMIGSNGGGEFVALDLRKCAPWPIVALDMVNSDLDESALTIADDFDAFLELVGIESDEAT
jgi:hypothetical protein